MSRVVFLLIGLGAGVAVGLLLQTGRTPERTSGRLSATTPPREAVTRPGAVEGSPPAGSPDATSARRAKLETIEPADPIPADEVEEGQGRVVVDFERYEGTREAHLTYVDARGGRDDWSETPVGQTHVVSFEVPEGTYDVWWLDGRRRRGVRARVASGQVTRVVARSDAPPLIPSGVGVLGVQVAASWGGSLAHGQAFVELADEWISVELDANGCASATLRPGIVTVGIGDLRRSVSLPAGVETFVELQHENEGDLLLEGLDLNRARRVGVRRIDGSLAPSSFVTLPDGVEGFGFVYLAAGRYELFQTQGQGTFGKRGAGTKLGTVEVLPRQATRFRVAWPSGGIDVRVSLDARPQRPGLAVRLARVADGQCVVIGAAPVRIIRSLQEAAAGAASAAESWGLLFDGLLPGTYEVTADGCATETVDVGGEIERVILRKG